MLTKFAGLAGFAAALTLKQDQLEANTDAALREGLVGAANDFEDEAQLNEGMTEDALASEELFGNEGEEPMEESELW